MKDCRQFYINGEWTNPTKVHDLVVSSPANEDAIATISLGTEADVHRAVGAAKSAFDQYSQTTLSTRLALLGRIV